MSLRKTFLFPTTKQRGIHPPVNRKVLDCSCVGTQQTTEYIIPNNCCVRPIRSIQNKNGIINNSYMTNTSQLLQRRCLTYPQRAFNFLEEGDISSNSLTHFTANCLNTGNGCRNTVYRVSNPQFTKNTAVSGRERINRLKYNTRAWVDGSYTSDTYRRNPLKFIDCVSKNYDCYTNTYFTFQKTNLKT